MVSGDRLMADSFVIKTPISNNALHIFINFVLFFRHKIVNHLKNKLFFK